MRRAYVGFVLISVVAALGLVSVHYSQAGAVEAEAETSTVEESDQASAETALDTPAAEPMKKSCSTSSDCPHSKCKSGKCGSCSTSSDCDFGKCKSGQCGACSTSSDCDGWGKCKSGKCGACSTSSDCGRWGKCKGGRCTKSPY